MSYIADLHLHSCYSRATSKNANLEGYYYWARVKGIQLLGTGDFTHPQWYKELTEKLVPEGNGFYSLKNAPHKIPDTGLAGYEVSADSSLVKFCLSAEISSIYKKAGATRKVHTLLFAPDLETVAKINTRLATLGNIHSDGRPILGLDPKLLLKIVKDICPDVHLIPAHIWTPWFSLFGSKSGFDTIEDCFEELTPEIFALETGLSSDPLMNWRWSALDRFRLISNSDAHSPQKLGREATLFNAAFSYQALFTALKTGSGFGGTVEFYPEEGKYHLDGHRKCQICLEPEETIKEQGLCPTCGKPLTIGVMHRVIQLADRIRGEKPEGAADFRYLIPLPELLAEILETGPATQKVMNNYRRIIETFKDEFTFLLRTPLDDIRQAETSLLAEAVCRMRTGNIQPQAGYDGEFGVIRVFTPGELETLKGQQKLFSLSSSQSAYHAAEQMPLHFSAGQNLPGSEQKTKKKENLHTYVLNAEQEQILASAACVKVVIAGPGTGKTSTLTAWLQLLVEKNACQPEEILAITFTNKASVEMRSRLAKNLPSQVRNMKISTFHSFCFELLQERNPEIMTIYDEHTRLALLKALIPDATPSQLKKQSHIIEQLEEGTLAPPGEAEKSDQRPTTAENFQIYEKYQAILLELKGIDLAGIITRVNRLFSGEPAFLAKIKARYKYLAVDEFQDINHAQYILLNHLLIQPATITSHSQVTESTRPPEILVIGDPDQAIYGFRGSDIKLFFRFEQDYKAIRFSLIKNYRSTAHIVNAASALIAKNTLSSQLVLTPQRKPEKKIQLFNARDVREEVKFIATTIEKWMGGTSHRTIDGIRHGQDYDDSLENNFSFSSFAILFRTRSIRDAYVKYLYDAGIPTRIQDNISFFAEQPFTLALNLLKLIHNPHDLLVLHQLSQNEEFSNMLEPITSTAASAFSSASMPSAAGAELNRTIESSAGNTPLLLTKPVRELQIRIAPVLAYLTNSLNTDGLTTVLATIFTKYLQLDNDNPELMQKYSLLLEVTAPYGRDLQLFLKQIALSPLENEGLPQVEKVGLYTFHAAKGLEFPVVFVVAAEEGIIPIQSQTTESGLEEERRLFYVALTRAQETLFISTATERNIYGKRELQQPSRFLNELPVDSVEPVVLPHKKEKKITSRHDQLLLF